MDFVCVCLGIVFFIEFVAIRMPYILLITRTATVVSIEKLYLYARGQDAFLRSIGGQTPNGATPGAFKFHDVSVLETLELLETHGWKVVGSCANRGSSIITEYIWTLRKEVSTKE